MSAGFKEDPGEMLGDSTLSAYLSVLQESALDSLPPSQDSLEFPEEEASSQTADGSRGTKRAAATVDQDRLVQNAAAQKRYRIRQKNEKEQAKEKHAALERRMKSIEDLCSVMQSQIAMLEAAQRVQMQGCENSLRRAGSAADARHAEREANAVRCHSLVPPTPKTNEQCESSMASTVEAALQGQIPLEQMVMARIRAMLGIVKSGERPDIKTDQLLRSEIRSFWKEKQRFEQRFEGQGFGSGLEVFKSTLLVNAMDLAPQGQVDIDQELYAELMRCRDKAQYSSEVLDRVVAIRDSYAATMHTIQLDREAINAEIVALMQQSHSESLPKAEETAIESNERAVVATSTASREPWEWQERTRNAYRIVQATDRLSTSLQAERDAAKTWMATLFIETLPPVVSANIVLVILEAKHRYTLRHSAPHEVDRAEGAAMVAAGAAGAAWYPKFAVTLRTAAAHLSKMMADRHAPNAE